MEKCPLCSRALLPDAPIDKHHLIPKSQGGREVVLLHKMCHRKIHSLFTEKELAKKYNSIEKLLAHEEIKKFVEWIKNKPSYFYDGTVTANRKKRN